MGRSGRKLRPLPCQSIGLQQNPDHRRGSEEDRGGSDRERPPELVADGPPFGHGGGDHVDVGLENPTGVGNQGRRRQRRGGRAG